MVFYTLGHFITSEFADDMDIEREIRNLYIRGNTIIRRFHFLSVDVKCALFKAYCYPMYISSLWSKYRQSSINKLRVAYNNIFRKLLGLPPWHSARTVFVDLGVKSFYENIRTCSYSLMHRVTHCNNMLVSSILNSNCFVVSATRKTWCINLSSNNHIGWFGLM